MNTLKGDLQEALASLYGSILFWYYLFVRGQVLEPSALDINIILYYVYIYIYGTPPTPTFQLLYWYLRDYVKVLHGWIPGGCHYRRKFRSQTSDNMDRWKAEMGRVREEKRRRKKIKEEKVRRKKMQVREKLGQSRNTAFFQWFVGLEGRKVGSLKRRVRSHLARWEMKNCTLL